MARVAAQQLAAALLLLLLLISAAAGTDVPFAIIPRRSLEEDVAEDDYGGDGVGGGAAAGGGGTKGLAGNPVVAEIVNKRLKALTATFARAIRGELGYCIKDTYVALVSDFGLATHLVLVVISHLDGDDSAGTRSGTKHSISPRTPPSSTAA
jgi:hypothetical protein